MIISKIFNNNCVATIEDDQELILTGSGIGFQKKVNDEIEEDKVEKKFAIVQDHQKDFEELLDKIPIDYFETTRTIVEYAEQKLDRKLNDGVNVPMTDHISSAIYRYHEDMVLPNLFVDDFKTFYPKEYEVAKWALNFINETYEVELPNDELAYLVMHLVNASNNKGLNHAQNTVYFINRCIEIVEKDFGIELDKESLTHQRFTTHLKYLSQRVFSKDTDDLPPHTIDDDFSLFVIMKLKKYDHCVNKINTFIKHRFDYELSRDEKMYISIHLHQLISSKKTK